MELNEALERIKTLTHRLPAEEIACIREHREAAIPVLLDYVKAVVASGEDNLPDDYDAHSIAMYLLAEFRVNAAFPVLIKYLEMDDDFIDWVLGDILTEGFGSILASVLSGEDIPAVKAVIENMELDAFHRSSALSALVTRYAEGDMEHGELSGYLGALLSNRRDDEVFLTLVVDSCADIHAPEHLSVITSLYEDDLVDEEFTTLDSVKAHMLNDTIESALTQLRQPRWNRYVTDTVDCISVWRCFREKPDFGRKVGRNEPCPCGSGKKYKKCCGAAV